MSSETKPTAGPWMVGNVAPGSDERWNASSVYAPNGEGVAQVYGLYLHTTLSKMEQSNDPRVLEGLANARLIAEAGTVLHETGMGPMELADKAQRLSSENETLRIDQGASLAAAELADRVKVLEGERAELLEALKFSLSHIAHKPSCCSINPTEEWATRGSVTVDSCKCDRKTIITLIAKLEGTRE